MDTLYIIGNGFDLHHGLDTSYKNFRDNVVLKTPNLRKLLLDLYGDAIVYMIQNVMKSSGNNRYSLSKII